MSNYCYTIQHFNIKSFFVVLKPVFSIICITIICATFTQLYASVVPGTEGTEAWRFLEQADIEFERGNFGNALKAAENAKSVRRLESEWSLQVLETACKPLSVQKVGDDIFTLLDLFRSRQNLNAVVVLEKSLELKDVSYFNSSIDKVFEYWKQRFEFPEADVIIANIYAAEGELDLARYYLEHAWDNSNLLDIPDEKYNILYKLSNIADLQSDNDLYEKVLLLIIAGDAKNYTNSTYPKTVARALKNGMSAEKFFKLYRYESRMALTARIRLTDYYREIGAHDKALQSCAMAAITVFSTMYNTLSLSIIDYSYVDIKTLFSDSSKNTQIRKWMIENDAERVFHSLAILSLHYNNEGFYSELEESLLNVFQ